MSKDRVLCVNGEAGFNRKVTCTVSRNGDLIHRMFLRVNLPDVDVPVKSGSTVTGFRWLDWIGHVLVKTVEIEIGGQKIDKHYGEWLAIWNELTQTAGHALGYADMVGHTPDLTDLKVNTSTTDVLKVKGKELWLPLQFWFNRNPGLALPLIALQYHEVKLNIEFREVTDCYWAGESTDSGATWTAKPQACRPSNFTSSLFVDYIYLDTDERRRFAQSSHEYLIEQLQFTGDESIPANTTSWKSKLNFNHPCKSLVWVIQRDAFTGSDLESGATLLRPGKQWFNWTTLPDGEKVDLGGGVFAPKYTSPQGDNTMVKAKLQLNGHDRFSERGARYFNLVQPFQHYENVPTAGVYVYSFGLKPEEHQPSGTCNMSRIDNATLQFDVQSGLGACRIKIFAVNYNVLRIMSGPLINGKYEIFILPMACKSYTLRQSGKYVVGNRLSSQCTKMYKLVASSWRLRVSTAKSLVVRESPKAIYPKVACESSNWLRIMNSGMGKVKWMTVINTRNGQPACLSPKPVMVGHGEAPETERRLVCTKEPNQLQHAYDTVRPLGKLSGTNRWAALMLGHKSYGM